MGPSVTMLKGDALKLDTTGRLILCTATDKALYISAQAMTSTAGTAGNSTDFSRPLVFPAGKGLVPYEVDLALLLDAVIAASAGSTVTCILPCGAGSTNDLIGSVVYSYATDEHRLITANTYGGGNVTITVLEPWTSAYAAPAGDKFAVNSFGPVDAALNFGGTRVAGGVAPGVAGTLARTGGNITCISVSVSKKVAVVTFNP
jgi:hypothetical protein